MRGVFKVHILYRAGCSGQKTGGENHPGQLSPAGCVLSRATDPPSPWQKKQSQSPSLWYAAWLILLLAATCTRQMLRHHCARPARVGPYGHHVQWCNTEIPPVCFPTALGREAGTTAGNAGKNFVLPAFAGSTCLLPLSLFHVLVTCRAKSYWALEGAIYTKSLFHSND